MTSGPAVRFAFWHRMLRRKIRVFQAWMNGDRDEAERLFKILPLLRLMTGIDHAVLREAARHDRAGRGPRQRARKPSFRPRRPEYGQNHWENLGNDDVRSCSWRAAADDAGLAWRACFRARP